EERVRAGRVRLVLGAPGRHPRRLVPRPRRGGGRTRGGDGGGPRRRRRPAPGAGGLRGGRGRTVRLLYSRADRRDGRSAPPAPVAHRRRDSRGALRQPLPLYRLREDPGRGQDGGLPMRAALRRFVRPPRAPSIVTLELKRMGDEIGRRVRKLIVVTVRR